MNHIAWVHDDALRHWWGDAPALYVFDDNKLKREQWSLKRIGFLYECLLELPLEIRRGDPVEQVRAFQHSHNAGQVITISTPDPHLQQQTTELGAHALPDEPFLQIPGKLDLRRFSRYWAKAERHLPPADTLKR
jgi:hypothetical protein